MKHYAIDGCCYKTDYENLIKTGYMCNLTKKAMDKEKPGLESFFEVISNHFDFVRKELAEDTMNKKATAEKPSNSGKLNDKDLFFSVKDIFEAAKYITVFEARERNPFLYEIFWLVTTYYVEKVATYHKRMNKLEAVGGSEDPFIISTIVCEGWLKSAHFLKHGSEKDNRRTWTFGKTSVSWLISTLIDDRDDITSLDEPVYSEGETTLGDTLANDDEEKNRDTHLFFKQKNKQFFSKTTVSNLILLTLINIETGRLRTGYKEELIANFNSPTDFYKYMLEKAAPYMFIDVNHAIKHACNIESEVRRLLSWSSNTYTTHAHDVYEEYIRWIKSDEPIYHPPKSPAKRRRTKK